MFSMQVCFVVCKDWNIIDDELYATVACSFSSSFAYLKFISESTIYVTDMAFVKPKTMSVSFGIIYIILSCFVYNDVSCTQLTLYGSFIEDDFQQV